MRVVNLTHGSGNGVDKACLMTAANMLIGKPKEGDNCGCVCPVIRAFIITTNDEMPEPLLSELYGPLVWEILGTKSTPEVELQRAYLSADFAVRTLVPIVLDNYGAVTEAESLRALPAIVDQQSARAAYAANAANAARAANAAYAAARAAYAANAADAAAAANAAHAAAYAARAGNAGNAGNAANAARAANAANAAHAAAYAANAAAHAANAARAAYAANAAAVWSLCRDHIRAMVAIGDTRPVETVISHDVLCDRLEGAVR
jgi:pyruvate/2-oxoglutarate dehydrogenase complex dihydrolipoamide acyltransferase (E2) component